IRAACAMAPSTRARDPACFSRHASAPIVAPVATVRRVTRPTSATEIGGRLKRRGTEGEPLRGDPAGMVQLHYYRSGATGLDPGAVPAPAGDARHRPTGGDAAVMGTRLAGVLAAGLLVASTTSVVRAQDDDDPTAWHVTLTPYAWAPGLDGDVTVRGGDASLDASFIDIIENTDVAVGLAGHLEVTRGPFGVFGDGVYLKTKVEDAGRTGLDVTTRMWFLEFGAQYRLLDTRTDRVPGVTFELYGGGRYSFLELGLDTQGAPSI